MTIDEQIAILQAAKAGKAIEFKVRNSANAGWFIWCSGNFDFISYEYRIKREPREFWAVDDGSKYIPIFFSSKEDLESYCNQHKGVCLQFKVREVIE